MPAVVGGEIGEGGDGLGMGEIAVADQQAADDFDIGMNQRRETVEGGEGFEMIAVAGAGGG